MRSSTKKTVIVLSVITALLLGAYYALFFLTQKNLNKAAHVENEVELAKAIEDQDNSLADFLKDISVDTDKLATRIVDTDGTVGFIEMIEGLANESGLTVEVKTITVDGKPDEHEAYEMLRLALTTSGTWSNSYHFLSMLESLPYKLTIQEISLHKETQEVTVGTTTVSRGSSWEGTFTITVLKKK